MAIDPAAITAHKDHLRRLSADGGPLRAEGPNATTSNREWFRKLPGGRHRATSSRDELHKKILDDFVSKSPDVAQGRRCIVLSGPPGAGKSTLLKKTVIPEESDRLKWRVIDADDFKLALLDQAVSDGSYHEHLVPAEVRQLEEQGERFFPLELASLVHEESSALSRRARKEAIERGDNLIVDTVLSNPNAARELGAQLAAAGYRVEVVNVETTLERSAAAIAHRWEKDYVEGLESTDPNHHGGRWVPSEYPRTIFVEGEAESRSAQASQSLAETCPSVMRLSQYAAAERIGDPAVLIALRGRTEVGGPLLSGPAYKAARIAAQMSSPTTRRVHTRGPSSAPTHER